MLNALSDAAVPPEDLAVGPLCLTVKLEPPEQPVAAVNVPSKVRSPTPKMLIWSFATNGHVELVVTVTTPDKRDVLEMASDSARLPAKEESRKWSQ